MQQQPLILFDGICNFCNNAVNFVIKRDKTALIQFAPLQSDKATLYLQQFNLPIDQNNTFVFIEATKAYTQSTAVLKVCRHLKGLWPICYVFIIVPKFIRDGVYNWVAKNRYKWFGQREECMLPTPEISKRFL